MERSDRADDSNLVMTPGGNVLQAALRVVTDVARDSGGGPSRPSPLPSARPTL